jgi:hypothetical protein
MRAPFQTDERSNVVDYNWQVDGILKNSQSYNKEGKNGSKTDPPDQPQVQYIQDGDILSFKSRQATNEAAAAIHPELKHSTNFNCKPTKTATESIQPLMARQPSSRAKEEKERFSPEFIDDQFAQAPPHFGSH